MGLGRTVAVGVLTLVLLAVLFSANVVVAADRTVLDAEYTKQTADEAGLYGFFTEQLRAGFGNQVGSGGGDNASFGLDPRGALDEAVTEEYVQRQGDRNVERLYGYLRGDREELSLAMNTTPVKRAIAADLRSEVRPLDLRAADVPQGAAIEEMNESRERFLEHRQQFRERQKRRIQNETDRELTEPELEAALERRMDDIREELYDRMDRRLDEEFAANGSRAPLKEPARTLLSARIDALTGEATYEEYKQRVVEGKDALAAAIRETIETELSALPDSVDVTENLPADATRRLETARTGVSMVGPLTLALPAAALLLAVLLVWLVPLSAAAFQVGSTAALAGVVGVVGSVIARDQASNVLASGGAPGAVQSFTVAFVTGFMEALTTQSGLLLALGAVLVVVGFAIKSGWLFSEGD